MNWKLSWCICSRQFFCLIIASLKLIFLGSFWKSFSSKHEVLSEYSTLTLSFIFQNHNFFRFSWHIIGLVCCIVTIVSPTQRSRLSKPPRYLRRTRKAHGKFSRDIWKKFFSKHEVLSKYSNLTLSFIFIFRAETFVSNVSRKFSVSFTNTSKLSGRFA